MHVVSLLLRLGDLFNIDNVQCVTGRRRLVRLLQAGPMMMGDAALASVALTSLSLQVTCPGGQYYTCAGTEREVCNKRGIRFDGKSYFCGDHSIPSATRNSIDIREVLLVCLAEIQEEIYRSDLCSGLDDRGIWYKTLRFLYSLEEEILVSRNGLLGRIGISKNGKLGFSSESGSYSICFRWSCSRPCISARSWEGKSQPGHVCTVHLGEDDLNHRVWNFVTGGIDRGSIRGTSLEFRIGMFRFQEMFHDSVDDLPMDC